MSHTQRSVVTGPAALDPRSRALLELQRESLARSLWDNQPEPSVGDVWVTRATWPTGIAKGLAAMIVVLRAFTEAWSARTLYDVAPLSDDERLASEWSLLLGADASGLGFPIVAHIDAQCTTTSSMLTRRLGALAEAALADLHLLLQAYESGYASTLKLALGYTGRRSIRHHLEWEEFASALLAIAQELAAPLLDGIDGTSEDEETSANEPSLALVRGESPPPYGERWAFEWNPPRLLDRAPDGSNVLLLGHVIALYLQDRPAQAPQREALQRLRAVFDLPYEEIAALSSVQGVARLQRCFAPFVPESALLAFVSRGVMHWRTVSAREGERPTLNRLAARKADPRQS